MKKWYDEEYEWEIEVIGFLRGDHTERYCRNGEEIGCVSQQPYAMGYQTIWAAVETTAPKKSVVIEKNVLSNPAWIDADCLDDPDYSGYLYTE